jgi:hypothetical protein
MSTRVMRMVRPRPRSRLSQSRFASAENARPMFREQPKIARPRLHIGTARGRSRSTCMSRRIAGAAHARISHLSSSVERHVSDACRARLDVTPTSRIHAFPAISRLDATIGHPRGMPRRMILFAHAETF